MTSDENPTAKLTPQLIAEMPQTSRKTLPLHLRRTSLSELIQDLESEQLKPNLPDLEIGDLVKIGVKIKDDTKKGDTEKERIQFYEGTIIAQHRGGLNWTITVRRTFQGIGVERVFLPHSPQLSSIEVLRRSKVRRAKLYYLRDRIGKQTRLKERFDKRLMQKKSGS